MACGCNNPTKIDVEHVSALPIDSMTDLPDFLLAVRAVEDERTGNVYYPITRIPTGRIAPNGNLDNVTAVVANNDSLDIPTGQVRACYLDSTASTYSVQYADTDNAPMFIVLGKYGEDKVLIQNCGVISLPSGHSYIIGAQYYSSDDGTGEPTTNSASGHKLFIPLSKTQLLVTFNY